MTPAFWRYTAFQIPGWLIAAIGGWWVHRRFDVPASLVVGLIVAWVIKDFVLYPFLRFAYETDDRRPYERLVAMEGTAAALLSPSGYVKVRGELWRARTVDREPVRRGDRVTVTGLEGTTLLVRPFTDQDGRG